MPQKLSNYLRHQLIHTNERKHTCITCGVSFKQSETIKQHLSVHGLDAKFYQTCGKIFRTQNQLDDHKLRNFLCHICGMDFKTETS